MYEDGSLIKVVVEVGEDGLKELEFVGRVVVDGSDFMAIQFDTLIIRQVFINEHSVGFW